MNIEYISVNNTVLIKDDRGKIRKEKYTPNIKEKLECENVIESLEDIYNKIENIIENDKIPNTSFKAPIYAGIGDFGLIMLFCDLANRNLISEDLFEKLAFGSIPLLLVYMVGYLSKIYHNNQEHLKKHCAYNRVSVMACQLWCASKIKLTELKIASYEDKANSESIEKVIIDTTDQLEAFKKELEFYYQIALEENKWINYYNQDILELKAQQQEYDENQIKLIRKYCQKFSEDL